MKEAPLQSRSRGKHLFLTSLCLYIWHPVHMQILLTLPSKRALNQFPAPHFHMWAIAPGSSSVALLPSTLALSLIEAPYTRQVRPFCWLIFIVLGIKSNFKTCSRALQVSTRFAHIHLPRLSWNPIPSCPLNSSLTGLLWVPTQWACFCFRTFEAAIPSAWNVPHVNISTPWAFLDPPNFSSHFELSLFFIAHSFDTVLFSVYLFICKFSLPPLLQWI